MGRIFSAFLVRCNGRIPQFVWNNSI
jgi:hypothetical protein